MSLIVAGGGQAVDGWRAQISRAGLSDRIRLLGFFDRIKELLAAADLLVSPVRYEAYGLNVQEAICRGIPALVSGRAGIAERYTPELSEMILPDPGDENDLVDKLQRWRTEVNNWKQRFFPFAETLRHHTWHRMAHQIVTLAETQEHSSL